MFVCSECGASQVLAGACNACGGLTHASAEDVLLGTSVGPYRIARLLGVGGMGRVYKGVQPQIGSRVAIKVLSRECTDRKDLVERFFSEARAVNLIRHESIVNVLDLSILPDGRPYIVMEYLDGAPLSDLVTRLGAMPLGGVCRLTVEVLDALGAAHAKGIVHRDLKPDNIFVTPVGRAKVLDFGIAKLLPELGGSFTQTGSLLGTPHYMSPEQASGKGVDFRTDLYAMGVILFECVTGQKPFHGDSMFDLLRKHVDLPPPPPRALRPDLPPALEHIILVALAKDPHQRFPSAAAMTGALQQASAGLPPAQWAIINGSAAGVAPATPSGASWGTPASWAGTGRMDSAPAPGAAARNAAGPGIPARYDLPTPGRAGGAPVAYDGPYRPQDPHIQHHSTATAGQVVGGKRAGRKKGWWWALGLLAVAASAAAVAVTVTDQDKTAELTIAAPGAPAVAPSPAPPPAPPALQPDKAGSDPSVAATGSPSQVVESAVPAVAAVESGDEIVELRNLVKGLPQAQRAMVIDQLRLVERQIKSLPAAQRAMVLAQLRSSLAMAHGAAEADGSDDDTGAGAALAETAEADAPDDNDKAASAQPPLPARWDGKRFDVMAYLPSAVAVARNIAADAALFRIDAEAVLPDGIVDLSQGTVRYGFISKTRATRPRSVPLGAKWDPDCQINIWVEPSGITVREFSGCKETTVPVPRCSLQQRWQQAIAKGAPRSNAIAAIGYRASVINGKPIWFFDIGDAYEDGPSPDVCP
jgi:Protein kinase domain